MIIVVAFLFDIPETVLFGNTHDPIFPTHSRRLQSKDSKAVTIYIPSVYQHQLAHNMFQQAQSLISSDTQNHDEAESIDKEITQSCLHGENQCRKRRSDWWHLELHQLKFASLFYTNTRGASRESYQSLIF